MRELPPADPFPVDALGDVLGGAAYAIHDRVSADCDRRNPCSALPRRAGHADVVLPIGGGSKADLFYPTVAATGSARRATPSAMAGRKRGPFAGLRPAHLRE
jgi:hypothetical protein